MLPKSLRVSHKDNAEAEAEAKVNANAKAHTNKVFHHHAMA